jgi:Winged helix DNA-binding domain
MPGDEGARLSWARARARRLHQHALDEPLCEAWPAQIAARMCGVHAQVMSAAEWSIGQRLDAPSRAGIQAALQEERTLVKTYGPRGTVHLLAAADMPMWAGALAATPHPLRGPASDYLSPDQAEAVLDAIAAPLATAELTVSELAEAVVTACGAWAGDLVLPAFGGQWPRWRAALPLAFVRRGLCFGPGRGRAVTFTSLRRWLPGFTPAAGPEALGWLVTQYLSGYGPATPEHFAQWLGAPHRWAVDLFAELAPRLRQADLAGMPAWLPAGEADGAQLEPARGVRLLPYFDSYVVGAQPRALLFEGQAAERALSATGQAGTLPVLLIDGAVRGIWHQRKSGRRVTITVEPFAGLTAAHRRELDGQAERLAAFLGCAPELTLAPVTLRSHL